MLRPNIIHSFVRRVTGVTTSRSAGHVCVPHTTELRLEAWAPTREQCLAEAVDALVDNVIERPRPRPTSTVDRTVPDEREESLLADLLDQVIYQVEVFSDIPVVTVVEPVIDGWHIRFEMADLATATPCGAIPKTASLRDVRLWPDASGRRCLVIIGL